MSLAIKTIGCNVNCKNCYEKKIRKEQSCEYDINKIVNTLVKEVDKHPAVTIHGGEPLLLHKKDLELLLSIIYNKKKQTSIQTNLLLLNERHLNLFSKYKTHVGISLDVNMGVRGYPQDEVIEKMTMLGDIKKSIICVLWKNSLAEVVEFVKYFYEEFGIVDFRFNSGIAFEDNGTQISNAELFACYKKIFDFTLSYKDGSKLKIQSMRDIIDSLLGSKKRTCIFNKCDPFHTRAEVPIFEDGSLGNCLKVTGANDGIKISRAKEISFVRYELLKDFDCEDCRYWLICFGGCPGEGIDNDWKRKTRFCEAFKNMFEYTEAHLKNLFPNLRTICDFKDEAITMEQVFMTIYKSTWQNNYFTKIEKIKEQCKKSPSNHGDSPHGDDHGDHHDGSKK